MKSSERALLLAAGEIPVGEASIKCRVETTGKTIGVVVEKTGHSQGFCVQTIQDLNIVFKAISNFMEKFPLLQTNQ